MSCCSRICPVNWLRWPFRGTCATASSPSTPATLTQACGGSTLCVSPAQSRTWCTSLRGNGRFTHTLADGSKYMNLYQKNELFFLAGWLCAQVWRRVKWHGPKTCSRPTCCYISMVKEHQAEQPRFFFLGLSLNYFYCAQVPHPSVRILGGRCCATVGGSLCTSWRQELMWVHWKVPSLIHFFPFSDV